MLADALDKDDITFSEDPLFTFALVVGVPKGRIWHSAVSDLTLTDFDIFFWQRKEVTYSAFFNKWKIQIIWVNNNLLINCLQISKDIFAMFEGGIITLQKRAYCKYEGVENSLLQTSWPILSRARWLLPEEKFDEPALEPLGLTHIAFLVMFLGVGLVISFLIFVVETKGLTVVLKQFQKWRNLYSGSYYTFGKRITKMKRSSLSDVGC